MHVPTRHLSILVAGSCLSLTLACGDDSAEPVEDFPELQAGCQPLLAEHHCTLPYPSDFFRVADPSLPSGYRIDVSGAAATLTDDDLNAEFTSLYDIDGYSRIPLIVGALPDVLVPDGLVDILGDFSATEIPTSQSVIIDASTGALVPHFTDVDPRAFDPLRRAIALHPVIDLEEKRRYIVVLQGIKNEAGDVAQSAQGFALLRDGKTRGIGVFDGVREHFEDEIFPIIEEAGIDRANIQLAWDFSTGSDENPMVDMLRIRELTMAWLNDNPPTIVIDEILEDPTDKPEIWRRIKGRITVPLYLESTEVGGEFHRDASGKVAQNGTAEADFLIHVPVSLRDDVAQGRALFYGHGFFGGRTELDGQLTRTISARLKTVMIATDWWGMTGPDIVSLIEDLSGDPIHTLRFADRVRQSMINWMVLTDALEELALLPELTRPDVGPGSGDGALAGEPLIDVANGVSFLGISQGHILGGLLAAILPRLDRVILHAGGGGLSHLVFRAEAFGALLQLISRHFQRPIQQYVWAAGTQRVFDRMDAAHYARLILRDPLPGASPRRVLMQMGVGDVAVPNFSTYLHARAIGLSAVSHTGLSLYGMPDVQEAESGFSSYDYGVDTEFYRQPMVPETGNDVHDDVRVEPAVLEQMDRFLDKDGKVYSTCDGPCDPG